MGCSAMYEVGFGQEGLTNMGDGRSLGDLVVAARDRAFVGQAAERALFRSALDEDPGSSPVF
ncbi:hypothetical protein QFZ76_001727 [Streptomyces sp. V4I2]|nr:hypothetical protein [Streptomyces sp. V4I2]